MRAPLIRMCFTELLEHNSTTCSEGSYHHIERLKIHGFHLFILSQPAISKHLRVLERAGLVVRGREAQWRPAKLQAAPLKEASDWMGQYRQNWEESFDRLGDYLQHMQAEQQENEPKEDEGAKNE